MLLADTIYKKGGKYVKKTGSLDYKKEGLLEVYSLAEGLTKNEVRKIKGLQNKGKLAFSTIRVHQTLPFAPFMFIGALLTLLAKGSFLLLFRFLF